MRDREQYFRSVMSGRQRGAGASVLRGLARAVEPLYGLATRVRNWMFDARLRGAHAAPRPVVCVGNITTGGTGKTPVVRWLADELRRRGHRPAVLMRGYKGGVSRGGSDEQRLLEELLSDPALPTVPVITDPDRVRGARRALEIDPHVTVFLLDDGFQHRRLKREFDLVLIDATNPFGHKRLLPRGLLREPLSSLKRATALLLTHVEGISEAERARIERELRKHNAFSPLYKCRHAHAGFIAPDGRCEPTDLQGRRYLAFCGIGNPEVFARMLETSGGRRAATHFFSDHHAYVDADVRMLEDMARSTSADVLITTEKDWVKLRTLKRATEARPPIWRAALSIEFEGDDATRLAQQVCAVAGERAAE